MSYSRKLTEAHKRKISEGVRRAWARVPVDEKGAIYLNINYDENNKTNFKAFLDDGTEIKK